MRGVRLDRYSDKVNPVAFSSVRRRIDVSLHFISPISHLDQCSTIRSEFTFCVDLLYASGIPQSTETCTYDVNVIKYFLSRSPMYASVVPFNVSLIPTLNLSLMVRIG